MATVMAPDVEPEDWAEFRAAPDGDPATTYAELLWTLISLALLIILVAFLVNDHPLRALTH